MSKRLQEKQMRREDMEDEEEIEHDETSGIQRAEEEELAKAILLFLMRACALFAIYGADKPEEKSESELFISAQRKCRSRGT
jgi:hypothetical protein